MLRQDKESELLNVPDFTAEPVQILHREEKRE
jgi:hypothetical protein